MNKTVLISIGAGTFFSNEKYLLVINIDDGSIFDTFSKKHQVYNESTKGFTGISLSKNNAVWICSEAELYKFDLNPISYNNYYTDKIFNDVHYCFYDDNENKLFVCNTGLDSVEEFNQNFNHVKSYNLVRKKYFFKTIKSIISGYYRQYKHRKSISDIDNNNQTTEKLFYEDIRYKNLKYADPFNTFKKFFCPSFFYNKKDDLRFYLFRPHILHPNFICKIQDNILITLKNTGSVIDLKTGKTIISNLSGPHDGILKNNIYLITESGKGNLLYSKDIYSIKDLQEKPFETIQVCDPKKGFVRGVDLIDNNTAVVAVSKRRDITDEKPAWVALVDLNSRTITKKIDIPVIYGTNPFSVIDISHLYKGQSDAK